MSSSVQDAINALTTCGFAVETSGGRYTAAWGGDIYFRQGSAREFLIFAGGVAAGWNSVIKMTERSSLERALENSPAHQAALKEGK